ncbi:unnamed protein product [Malus baccata var. baccata]
MRAWYSKLSSVLEKVGFTSNNADSSLFVRIRLAGILVVLIYVDNLIITGDNMDEITSLKKVIHKQFAIKDLGRLKYFLGIEMATFSKGLFLNQWKYVMDFLHDSKMLDCKPAFTPLDCKFKGSIGRGILMEKNGSTNIQAYIDVDWAGNALDHKSTTGGNLVTWKSKKQSVIAHSSAEAEYRAMASTACELIWLKGLLGDLGISNSTSMSLMCDNQAAMHITSNPIFHECTKHIEVDCHYVRAQVQSKVIQTVFTRSHDQLVDLFTKALGTAQFQRLLCKLGSINPLDPA